MTTTENPTITTTAGTPPCPPWCAGKHDDIEPGLTIHVRAVGTLGVEIVADEGAGVRQPATVYLPVIEGPAGGGDLTVDQAEQLVQDLQAVITMARAILAGPR